MEPDEVIGTAALRLPNQDWLDPRYTEARPAPTSAAMEVSALYQAHAVGLIRLAYVMLGDRAAEDAVQDAFCGLFRNRAKLADTSRALPHVRSAVLNGCRTAPRRQAVRRRLTDYQPPATATTPRSRGATRSTPLPSDYSDI